MRESMGKFRGKRVDNGEWVHGAYHKHLKYTPPAIKSKEDKEKEYQHIIIYTAMGDWNLPTSIGWVEVIPETVGEFITKADVNGVHPHVGDKLRLWCDSYSEKLGKAEQEWHVVVEYNEDACRFEMVHENRLRWAFSDRDFNGYLYKFEIIGNIHEEEK